MNMAGRTRGEEEQTLLELAQRVLPAGSFGNLAGDIVIREGRGGRVWDVHYFNVNSESAVGITARCARDWFVLL